MLTVISLVAAVLLILCFIKGIFNIVKAFILRAVFTKKLSKLCFDKKYKLTYLRSPYASFFGISAKPDVKVKTPEHEFVIRFFTCRQRKRIFYFVNASTYVKVFRVFFALPGSKRHDPFDISKKLGHIPALNSSCIGKDTVQVLLFNPSPVEINYIDEAGQKLLAGNGSIIHGETVYSASGFLNILGGRE